MGTAHGAGLGRDLALLSALAEHGGLTVGALVRRTGRTQTQVSRALAALAEQGVVERDPRSREYTLGWRLFALATGTTEARLSTLAGHTLRALARRVHADAHLCRRHGAGVATVLTAWATGGPAVPRWDLSDVPVHNTSSGRVLVADLSDTELTALAGESEVDGLRRIVDRARIDGYSIVDGEFDVAKAGASAPVRDHNGAIVAAVNVSGDAERLRPRLSGIAAATVAAAGKLSADLGYRAR